VNLDLTRNDIDDNGLKMIAEGMEHNDSIISLKLQWNHFDQLALKAFVDLKAKKPGKKYFFDFAPYVVDNHFEISYTDTQCPFDFSCCQPYYNEEEKL